MAANEKLRKPTKREKRLQARRHDYDAMMKAGSRELKVNMRMESGGYRCPGSLNK
jgi:hypothetical protein